MRKSCDKVVEYTANQATPHIDYAWLFLFGYINLESPTWALFTYKLPVNLYTKKNIKIRNLQMKEVDTSACAFKGWKPGPLLPPKRHVFQRKKFAL